MLLESKAGFDFVLNWPDPFAMNVVERAWLD